MGKPIQTHIKFSDFLKTVEVIGIQKFAKVNILNKSGSVRRIELFRNKNDSIPCNMWVVHEDKYIWSGDLKKACENLGVDKNKFNEVSDSL